MEAGALISELKRRRVIRALVGYGVAAFAVLQIIEPVMHGLRWPDEILSYTVVALAVGFPIVVSLAWIFDVKSGGIERTAPASSAWLRGPQLALLLVGIGVLAAAPGTIWYFVVRGITRPAASSLTPDHPGPSIAVLAFADMSPGKDQEYFSDGIAEEILNALAHVDGLRVAGRTSSFFFKGKSAKIGDVGRELNVANVLEGSVRKAGDQLRITAELISTADGYHLWSETYDRNLHDVFAVQDEIAKAVVDALKVKLVQRSPGVAAGARTENAEAYKHFLLGRHFQDHVSKEGSLLAEAEFRKAVALDPKYALAYAFLALSLNDQDFVNVPLTPEHSMLLIRNSMEEAERAVALGPALSVAYSARALARMRAWQWSGATSDIEQALALNASDPVALRRYGQLLGCIGRFDEAIAALRRSVDLDPLLPTSWSWLGTMYIAAGKLDLARTASERALRIAPAYDNGRADVAFLALLEGKPQTALELARQVEDQNVRLGIVAYAEHDLRHDGASMNAVEELAKNVGQIHPSLVAEAYAWRGEHDEAFEWFERAVLQHDSFLFTLKLDSTRDLRRDPRWPILLRKMNLPVE